MGFFRGLGRLATALPDLPGRIVATGLAAIPGPQKRFLSEWAAAPGIQNPDPRARTHRELLGLPARPEALFAPSATPRGGLFADTAPSVIPTGDPDLDRLQELELERQTFLKGGAAGDHPIGTPKLFGEGTGHPFGTPTIFGEVETEAEPERVKSVEERRAAQGLRQREWESVVNFITGVPAGLAEIVENPAVLIKVAPEIGKSMLRTATGQNLMKAMRGELTYAEWLIEDLSNVAAIASLGTLSAAGIGAAAARTGTAAGARVATGAAAAQKALMPAARPLHTISEAAGARAMTTLARPGVQGPLRKALPEFLHGRIDPGQIAARRQMRGAGTRRLGKDRGPGRGAMIEQQRRASAAEANFHANMSNRGRVWAQENDQLVKQGLADPTDYFHYMSDIDAGFGEMTKTANRLGLEVTDSTTARMVNAMQSDLAKTQDKFTKAWATHAKDVFGRDKLRVEKLAPTPVELSMAKALRQEVIIQGRRNLNDWMKDNNLVRPVQAAGPEQLSLLDAPAPAAAGTAPAVAAVATDAIPKGWQVIPAELKRSFGIADAGDFIAPRGLISTAKNFEKTLPSWATNPAATALDEFRAAVLLYSPRWQVNNLVGNTAMTAMEVGLTKTFTTFLRGRKLLKEGRVPPEVLNAIQREVHFSMGGRAGAEGRRASVLANNAITRGMTRANNMVDNIYRAGIWDDAMRKQLKAEKIPTGMRAEQLKAVQAKIQKGEVLSAAESKMVERAAGRANRALVDYGNLNNFERLVMRNIIPFYSWQRGILQLALSLPGDHPLRFAIIAKISQEIGGINADERASLPSWLLGLTKIPFTDTKIQTQYLNPFTDSLSLLDREMAGQAMSPFVKAAVQLIAPGVSQDMGMSFGKTEAGRTGREIPGFDPLGVAGEQLRSLPVPTFAREVLGMEGRVLGPSKATLAHGRGEEDVDAAAERARVLGQLFGFNIPSESAISRGQERFAETTRSVQRNKIGEEQRQIARRLGINLDEIRKAMKLSSKKSTGLFGR